ncbi:hypothetical protein [Alkaliphilus sp. B6464]|uniref:hypothetical protein n=1 Tax=Alkaliphilus sp. B6464 TaxID=2731219 RepID=UPI001BA6E2EE|nr:hypothetical protein [Alkaliphilus sp. B6464]QUH21251.1 hypothetical protein HYG84_16090 [Alkaliphilus sp. B6464]
MRNKGTYEGTEAEIQFVKYCNSNKIQSNPIWQLLYNNLNLKDDISNYYIVRVISHVYSKLSKVEVLPKADAYLVHGQIPSQILANKNYYLTESDIEEFNLIPCLYSGISIKRPDSKKFQILKLVPHSFNEIIGSYVLGAGASIYCNNKNELIKNDSVLAGWNTTWAEFKHCFSSIPNIEMIDSDKLSLDDKLKIFKTIKNISNTTIKSIIVNDPKKLDIVFKGSYIFDEPYPAHFLYKDGCFTTNEPFNFTVTTGSGRSKGDFTIVLKP